MPFLRDLSASFDFDFSGEGDSMPPTATEPLRRSLEDSLVVLGLGESLGDDILAVRRKESSVAEEIRRGQKNRTKSCRLPLGGQAKLL